MRSDHLQYLNSLELRLRLKAVVLFGSAARGEADRWSDLDLCVISEDLPVDFRERLDLLWKDKPAGMDVVGFRSEEVAELLFRPMVLDILLEGKVISGNADNLRFLARSYVEKEKLERTPYGYAKRRAA